MPRQRKDDRRPCERCQGTGVVVATIHGAAGVDGFGGSVECPSCGGSGEHRVASDDDADHIVRFPDSILTLCEKPAAERNVHPYAPTMTVDPGGICWTCLAEARRMNGVR